MNFTQFLLIINARKRLILITLFLIIAATLVVSLLLPKEYAASTTLLIDSKSKDPITGQFLPSQLFPGYIATQVEVINSLAVANKVIDEAKLLDSPGLTEQFTKATDGKGDIRVWLANRLLPKLDVQPSKESSIITLTFSGAEPGFAALMANAFAKAYIQTNLDLMVGPAKQTAAWYDQQIANLRTNLEQAQAKLSTYQREKGIVESDERLDIETRRLTELAGQLVGAQSAAFDAGSRTKEGQALPEVFNSPAVQGLKLQLNQTEAALADIINKVGKNHPRYIALQAEVEGIRAKLNKELSISARGVNATSTAANQRVSSLKSTYEAQKSKILDLKKQREEVSLLARGVENAQQIYTSAIQRYGQTRLESLATVTDVSVLDPASPPSDPSKPRILRNILIATLLGTMLGIGIGFLVELLDRRIRTDADILESLGIPLLATLSGKQSRLERFFSRLPWIRHSMAP